MESQEENNIIKLSQAKVPSTHNFKCTKFDPLWVQVLINLRMKHSKMFTRRRNSASEGWKLVFDELKESGAPDYVTISKIKKKWMNLMTRYRQIKNTTMNSDCITWPYYEPMNNALGKDFDTDADLSIPDNSMNQSMTNDEKQNFTNRLIELRCTHRHVFTGRKYTARDGWLVIQSMLDCQGKYSIIQLSKLWQNLVQRFKQLSKSQSTEKISWPYFEAMQKWFENIGPSENMIEESGETPEITKVECEIIEKEDEDQNEKLEQNSGNSNNVTLELIKIRLLTDIKVAQEKNYDNIISRLNYISKQLETIRSNLDRTPEADTVEDL
ncbi:unnamed protein product [Phaedon cochleariae]|uniref:Myb/SANT-like DNA-binding domain-containing protein n=1 Tax=Phaedon cochleariae TaxID=80249 RepID=A0A9P0GTA5_PHACE|nr:unnamed protein product [Phaedon cochleariae]